MKGLLSKLCLFSLFLVSTSTLAQAQPFSGQEDFLTLKIAFEQEFRSQLDQQSIEDDGSLVDVTNIAALTAQKIYGANPKLMRQKLLHELAQLPLLEIEDLSVYREEHSLDFLQLLSEESKLAQEFEALLPIYYGKPPADIAQSIKNILVARTWTAKRFGYQSLISPFLPDKTYRLETGTADSTLAVKSYKDNLFILTFDISESGLLKPLKIQWMKPQLEASS